MLRGHLIMLCKRMAGMLSSRADTALGGSGRDRHAEHDGVSERQLHRPCNFEHARAIFVRVIKMPPRKRQKTGLGERPGGASSGGPQPQGLQAAAPGMVALQLPGSIDAPAAHFGWVLATKLPRLARLPWFLPRCSAANLSCRSHTRRHTIFGAHREDSLFPQRMCMRVVCTP